MNFFQQKINWLQILIGALVLLIGALVYLIDRPPEHIYILSENKFSFSFYTILPNLFGTIGSIFPAFSHVFAFILITSGIASGGKKGCLVITVCWFLIDTLFEIGQKFGSATANLLPEWFESIPFLKFASVYFKNGTFDWFDIAAICAGSISAYFVLMWTMKQKRD